MNKVNYPIVGLSCQGCVALVTMILQETNMFEAVNVSLENRKVHLQWKTEYEKEATKHLVTVQNELKREGYELVI